MHNISKFTIGSRKEFQSQDLGFSAESLREKPLRLVTDQIPTTLLILYLERKLLILDAYGSTYLHCVGVPLPTHSWVHIHYTGSKTCCVQSPQHPQLLKLWDANNDKQLVVDMHTIGSTLPRSPPMFCPWSLAQLLQLRPQPRRQPVSMSVCTHKVRYLAQLLQWTAPRQPVSMSGIHTSYTQSAIIHISKVLDLTAQWLSELIGQACLWGGISMVIIKTY